jgi:hypothetical protein
MNLRAFFATGAILLVWLSTTTLATPFDFSTGLPDGRIATASRPDNAGKIEIETGDDFILTSQTQISHATFTGLITGGASTANVGQVVVEIYRVFPKDSDTGRTPKVPTRVNSPSDVAFDSRDSAAAGLSFTTTVLTQSFTAANSVLNGINPSPNQTTLGEGPVTGQEVQFDVTFSTPFDLSADHYFFVPQVEVTTANGEFFWLSAPKPIVAPGTPFAPDLQTWIRNENLAPDWLRVGTDIVGGGTTFNAAFSLHGEATQIPAPSALALAGLGAVLAIRRRKFAA